MMHSVNRLIPKTLLILTILLGSCQTGIPKADLHWWAIDPSLDALVRSQEGVAMKCTSSQANEYLCLSREDVRVLFNTYLLGCIAWRDGLPKMTEDQAEILMRFANSPH